MYNVGTACVMYNVGTACVVFIEPNTATKQEKYWRIKDMSKYNYVEETCNVMLFYLSPNIIPSQKNSLMSHPKFKTAMVQVK
jgi:hypothetical protein